MTRPLSNDLRRRVVTAVVDGGMSAPRLRQGASGSRLRRQSSGSAPGVARAAIDRERKAATSARSGSRPMLRQCLRLWKALRT